MNAVLKQEAEKRLEHMPRKHHKIYRKAMEGKSRKAAMHAFCLECCGHQIADVFECTDRGCPLYPYRPGPSVPLS